MFKLNILKLIIILLSIFVSSQALANNEHNFLYQIKNFTIMQMEEDQTPGVVLLINSPKLGTKTMALGFAALEPKQLLMNVNNNFRVASISKTFLAVMILKMVEQGKINLNQSIDKYLPNNLDLKLIPYIKKITVKNLLNMTSGIPEYYDLDVDKHLAKYPYKQWQPQDALWFSSDLKPKFRPGKGYQYSNTNYVLLQLILRNLTSKNLETNLQELICTPLGLKNTFADDFKMSAYTLNTKGYDTKKNKIDVSELDDGFGIGDTFVITTANDLNIFLNALFLKKKLLKPTSLQAMLTPNYYGRYGMGIEISRVRPWGSIYSHNGLVNGYQTNYFYLPKTQLTIIILTNNRATTLIEPVFVKILNLYKKYIN